MEKRRRNPKRDLILSNISPADLRTLNKSREIANAICSILDDRNITVEEFAFLMETDKKTTKQWLSGTHRFNLDTLYEISERLGLL